MDDDDQETCEQRRRRVLAEARDTLERVKDFAERRDDTPELPGPPDRVAEWRASADLRAAECTAAKAELQLPSVLETLELRLAQERQWTLDAIGEALAQALAEQRDFVLEIVGEAVAQLRSERDDSRSAEVNADFARVWQSLTEAHKAIVGIQRERLEEIVASERPAAAKLN